MGVYLAPTRVVVVLARIELTSSDYQSLALPLSYRTKLVALLLLGSTRPTRLRRYAEVHDPIVICCIYKWWALRRSGLIASSLSAKASILVHPHQLPRLAFPLHDCLAGAIACHNPAEACPVVTGVPASRNWGSGLDRWWRWRVPPPRLPYVKIVRITIISGAYRWVRTTDALRFKQALYQLS